MQELALCRAPSEWVGAFHFAFFLSPLFVWKSDEMKMIIIHLSTKKLMKAWKALPDFICLLFSLSPFVRVGFLLSASEMIRNHVFHSLPVLLHVIGPDR